jgi:hypothetical protein
MPFSKHRRKPGGKAVRHPGKGKQGKPPPEPPDMAQWRRFNAGYTRAFHAKHEASAMLGVGYLLDIVADQAFEPVFHGEPFQPVVSKAEVFREFMEHDEPGHEAEDAEAALRVLIEDSMVEMDGDEIRIPARFCPAEAR